MWLQLLFNSIDKLLNLFLNRQQKNLVSDMIATPSIDENLILVRYDKFENSLATGVLFFKNFEIAFKSGGWGKGAAPKGKYLVKGFRNITASHPNADAYTLFGIGFFVDLIPQFETDRTLLGIHFDGNVPGTLGCIGLQCSNIDDAIRVRNLFRDALESTNVIECRII